MAKKIDYDVVTKEIQAIFETKKADIFNEVSKLASRSGYVVSETTTPGVGTSYETVCPYCGKHEKGSSTYKPSRINCSCGNVYTTYNYEQHSNNLVAFKHNENIVIARISTRITSKHFADGTFDKFVGEDTPEISALALIHSSGTVRFERYRQDNGTYEFVKTSRKLYSVIGSYSNSELIVLDGITEIAGVAVTTGMTFGSREIYQVEQTFAKAPSNKPKTAVTVNFDYTPLGVEDITEFLISVNKIDEINKEIHGQAWCSCGNIFDVHSKEEDLDDYRNGYKFTCPNCGKEHSVNVTSVRYSMNYNYPIIQIEDNDTLNSWDVIFNNYSIDNEWNVTSSPSFAARVNKANGKVERYYNESNNATPLWKKTTRQNKYSHFVKIFVPDSLKYSGLKETWAVIHNKEYRYYSTNETVAVPKYISLWVKTPLIEQVVKRNEKLARIIWDNCSGSLSATEATIFDYAATNTAEFFGISERFMKMFCKDKNSSLHMAEYRTIYRADPNITEEAIEWIGKNNVNVPDIIKLMNYNISMTDIVAYLERVRKSQYVEPYSAIREWSDYLVACEVIGTDLNDKTVKFPRHLLSEHNIVINKRKLIVNTEKDEVFKARCEKYAKLFSYKDKDIIVKAPDDVKELLEEGRKLHHCVGSYADRIIEGSSIIFFIRRASEPDKPWLTVDLNEAGQIIELRGNLDKIPAAYETKYLSEWIKKKNINGGKWVA